MSPMKRLLQITCLFLVCFVNSNVWTQTYSYQEVNPYPFFETHRINALEGDVDGDNDIDVVLTGVFWDSITLDLDTASILYINDGNANFVPMPSFEALPYSDGVLGDIDGDGDLDLLLTGQNTQDLTDADSITSLLFKFNGNNFVLEPNSNIGNFTYSSSVLFDIDGDNDNDLLIMGQNDSLVPTTTLYTNDGSGVFSEVLNSGFVNVSQGELTVADIDNDNDLDVAILGVSAANQIVAEVYVNDGVGNFSTNSSLQLYTGIFYLSNSYINQFKKDVELVDFNNNGLPDLMFLCQNKVKMFSNVGNGNFIENNVALELFDDYFENGIVDTAVDNLAMYVEDFDADGDFDVIYDYRKVYSLGGAYGYNAIWGYKLLLNDGSGYFNHNTGTYLPFLSWNSVLLPFDADSDGDIDILNIMEWGNSWHNLFLYEPCNATYSNLIEVACVEYIAPSGIIYTQSGIYQDTIYNSKWCDSIITIDLTIQEVDVSVSVLSDMSLRANKNSASYQWGRCDVLVTPYGDEIEYFTPFSSETNQVFMPQQEGYKYGVIVSYDGCSDTSDCVNYYLGLEDVDSEGIKIFPNPTNGYVNFEFDNSKMYSIQIFDITGKQVYYSKTLESKININTYKNGVYFVKIYNDEYTNVTKVLKFE